MIPFYFKHDPSLSISKTELNLEEVRNIIFTVFKIINTSLKNFSATNHKHILHRKK